MKLRIASLVILCLTLMLPAAAQVLYDNGPINGATDAWTINFGFTPSDSFFLVNNSTVGGFNFGVWELPGDILTSVDWEISSEELSGTVYGTGTASGSNLTDQFISINKYGYNIDRITVTGLNVSLTGGKTYWLTLQNAVVPSGNPVYWDENSGIGCTSPGCPSMASETALGSIASEAFTINSGSGGTTPEPSSVMLFGSGVLGVAGLLRRKRL